jgi:hypothetical protein
LKIAKGAAPSKNSFPVTSFVLSGLQQVESRATKKAAHKKRKRAARAEGDWPLAVCKVLNSYFCAGEAELAFESAEIAPPGVAMLLFAFTVRVR